MNIYRTSYKIIKSILGKKMNILANFLNDELEFRQEKNPAYSLRSFAKDLKIDSSALSKIMSGKRIPEIDTIKELLKKLNATEETIELIIGKVLKEQNIKNFKIKKPVNDYREINQIVFQVISNPIHYTLLELIKTKNFKFDIRDIASRLSIDEDECENIIQNLEQLQMIKIEDDIIIDLTQGFSTHEIDLEKTSEANKNYQLELLHKSSQAIKYHNMTDRSHSAVIFATNKDKIYEAKGIIKKFRQSLCDFMEDTDQKDTVYALQVSLFSLTDD